VERRDLVALLYWLDRTPPSAARWQAEAIVLAMLVELDAPSAPAPPESGVFEIDG